MNHGNPNPVQTVPLPRGRPKGSQNKTTADMRAIILGAVDKMGGLDRMVEWAQSSPLAEQAFWTQVAPKVLPKEVNLGGQPGNPLNLGIKVSFVGTKKRD
jgi:hypothetical protein